MDKFNQMQELFIGGRTKIQHLQSNVIVPLIQNFVGGLSLGMLYYLYNIEALVINMQSPEMIMAAKIALVIMCIFNIIRFFGDELRLFYFAFRMGTLFSNQEKITANINNKLPTGNTPLLNATKLIIGYYSANIPIAQNRAANAYKFTRRQFEEARTVLINAGILKNARATTLNPTNKEDALKLLNEWKS